jgi:prepilin-type N-terminal cleavage/methylation domain-containing protein
MTRRPAAADAPLAPQRPRGFTLIEVLVAMMIFVTGAAGLLALLVTALALHRDGLNLTRATRDLDELRSTLVAEVAAGGHYDKDGGKWVDITSAALPDGTRYAVHFLAGSGVEPNRAELRVGASDAELAGAVPVILVLPEGPSIAADVARWRLRAARPEPAPAEH